MCTHYWIIETADGTTSPGRCKYCGETKRFLNAFPAVNPIKSYRRPVFVDGIEIKFLKRDKSLEITDEKIFI